VQSARLPCGHVVGHLQINHRSAIFLPSDLTECLGAVWIGVEKAKPTCTCGRTAGGSSSRFTLASLHECSHLSSRDYFRWRDVFTPSSACALITHLYFFPLYPNTKRSELEKCPSSGSQGADFGRKTFPASINGVTAYTREILSRSTFTAMVAGPTIFYSHAICFDVHDFEHPFHRHISHLLLDLRDGWGRALPLEDRGLPTKTAFGIIFPR
jgi:hypothetical protein